MPGSGASAALGMPGPRGDRTAKVLVFFQAVRSVLAKRAAGEACTEEELDMAIRQIVSRAVASEGVVDIFSAAGLEKPDIAILSEEFLAEVRGMKQRNLAVELLRKLLKGELAVRRRRKRRPSAILRRDARSDRPPIHESGH